MTDFNAVAEAGDTLVALLRDKMKDLIPADSIMLISPGDIEAKDNVRISLFLYKVEENGHLKNQEMQAKGSDALKAPPLPLDLYYMLTSHPSSGIQDKTERTREEHSVLGRAMQILNDNSAVSGTSLKGSLAQGGVSLHITTTTLSLDDMTKIWNTFQGKPFRPSVCYLVTPVMIESAVEKAARRGVEVKFR